MPRKNDSEAPKPIPDDGPGFPACGCGRRTKLSCVHPLAGRKAGQVCGRPVCNYCRRHDRCAPHATMLDRENGSGKRWDPTVRMQPAEVKKKKAPAKRPVVDAEIDLEESFDEAVHGVADFEG